MASQYFCISVLLYFLYLGLAGCARTEAVGWWLWGHHGTIALHGLPPLLQLARILFASRLSRNLFPPSSQLICWNLASCNHGSMARTGLHHLLQLRRTGRFFAKSVSTLVSAFFYFPPTFLLRISLLVKLNVDMPYMFPCLAAGASSACKIYLSMLKSGWIF